MAIDGFISRAFWPVSGQFKDIIETFARRSGHPACGKCVAHGNAYASKRYASPRCGERGMSVCARPGDGAAPDQNSRNSVPLARAIGVVRTADNATGLMAARDAAAGCARSVGVVAASDSLNA